MSRSITTAMAAWLSQDVRTFATCVQVTRGDGAVFGFTDHDTDIVYNGIRYVSSIGYTSSAIEASCDMSTSNLEVDGLLIPGGAVSQADVEAGVWSNAAVLIFGVNYSDLTMGQINLTAGNLGQWTILDGAWKVELRGLAQMLQQTITEQFSPGCRATFGDSKCAIPGGVPTSNGTVQSIVAPSLAWNDTSLTQTGPNSPFVDTVGHFIPTIAPYQVQVVAPSGSFVADSSVKDAGGNTWTRLPSGPGQSGAYTVSSGGLYGFDSSNAGAEVFINFTYAVGYFAYGKVVWTSGQNKGFTSAVKVFSPGVVTLGLPTPNPIAVGDTYTIYAGCDKQMGTCRDRWNNLVHFRGEPYVPGPDTLLAPQGS
ncbi:DUF2163 domain-containing protein [Burkholderia cenocepacia]|uniref:DUF2163 domain-containing protein n=1 Tax=Burkholderia cenocepacia TaxID=95486 RepID=UPI0026505381|nr:DUF2163 domain-containing protein [Burkholderia cenocepacia]MDN7456602.1 DUF2163 domain-containing protein [Burkholderia cenocepacia]